MTRFGEPINLACIYHSGNRAIYERLHRLFRDIFDLLNLSYMRRALYRLTKRNSSSSSRSGTVKESTFPRV